MKNALAKLQAEVSRLQAPALLSEADLKSAVANCQVALMTGGASSRFQEVPGASGKNKNSMQLPNGDTMLEMTIRMYQAAGIKDFIALVYHNSHTVEQILGDGSKWDINISYSYDPARPVGKGGAIRNALDNGSIDPKKTLIVHNPDDVILKDSETFPRLILSGHRQGIGLGKLATVVVVEATPYTYTGMKIIDNEVKQIEMYPMIPLPTHIGVTIFSSQSFDYFSKYFDLKKKSDFEKVLFPILSQENKLYAVGLPNDHWLAVNNLKNYQQLLVKLGLEPD